MHRKMKLLLFILFLATVNTPSSAQFLDDTAENVEYFQDEPIGEIDDPIEGFNRVIFEFNMALDILFFEPISELYAAIFPQPVRNSIQNVVLNINAPVIFANDLLQGEFSRAGTTLSRFVINTTAGVGGLFDVADEIGLPYHSEDFGQTLAAAGIGGGPFLIIPILGPSNPRDLIGKGVDLLIAPQTWILHNNDLDYISYIYAGVWALNDRTNSRGLIKSIRESPDPYTKTKEYYIRNREFKIRNGRSEINTSDLPSPKNAS
jgi:phospholipid-binding lipoprotein MlaA